MTTDPHIKNARRPVRLGKYEVVKHIASGGMGAVYKARDPELDRDVALKILPPEMASNPSALERFKREARNAAKLQHENIVRIHEFGEFQGTWYLALEFVEGIDLYEYIKRKGKLEPEEARRITIQAALALQHAYRQGIVHRDIKPSNFLVTRKNDRLVVKMTDLGLSRESVPGETRVTRDGTTVGTVDYMAPEQARDSSRADTRSDIYSLGCSLYHMLAGKPPFSEGGLTERLYAHVQDEAADLRQFNPRVSEALMAVVRRMLAKQPADRYQTPAELVKELLNLDVVVSPVRHRDVLAGLARGEADTSNGDDSDDSVEPKALRRRTVPDNPRVAGRSVAPAPDQASTNEERDQEATPAHSDIPRWVVFAAAGALLLLAILAGVLMLRRTLGSAESPPPELRRHAANPYNKPQTIMFSPETLDAICTAGHAPRRLGDGVRPGRVGAA
jgi:serine/threonine-protein kinase